MKTWRVLLPGLMLAFRAPCGFTHGIAARRQAFQTGIVFFVLHKPVKLERFARRLT